MDKLPSYINLLFAATTLLTIFFFYKASRSRWITITLIAWIIIQAFISRTGFYVVTDTIPPRFLLLVLPPLLLIVLTFILPRGRKFMTTLDQRWMAVLHVVRIPVEIVLFLLFIHKQVPQIMTFEGRNYDILSGITAPFILYFGYYKPQFGKTTLLLWNFVCLGLLFNIVIIAILAAPFPFQQFGFDQPNVAILHFPFVWLPCLVVPLVLFSHLVIIQQLLSRKSNPDGYREGARKKKVATHSVDLI